MSIDTCIECGCSVAWGSGNYVNRVPADGGWLCPDCQAIECDECGCLSIELDHPPHDDTIFLCVDCLDACCSAPHATTNQQPY